MGGYIALTLACATPKRAFADADRHHQWGAGIAGVPKDTGGVGQAAHLDAVGFARATMPLSSAPGWVEEHANSRNC